MIIRFCHGLLHFYYRKKAKQFDQACGELEATQRGKLENILLSLRGTLQWKSLSGKKYEDLRELLPLSQYADYRELIDEQRHSQKAVISSSVQRYEPTSGSTDARKWIPYSKLFLTELNQAAGAWLGDLAKHFPGLKKGTHYWSLSWLPQELRGLATANDAELFPLYQRWILKKIMAVPAAVSEVSRPEGAWRATLLYLMAQENLTLVSVWSPTFWLKIMGDVKEHWAELSLCLREGTWGSFEEELGPTLGRAPRRNLTSEMSPQETSFFKKMWPHLKVISAWDSFSSGPWAEQIKREMPQVAFQGKGLWATEGVVTIPFQGHKVLALQSHFFEFKDLQTGDVLPAWEVKKGREYQPLLWTSSGLLRYALQDRVQVSHFYKQTPCFEFKGRLQSVDLVGEKMDAAWVQELFLRRPEWRAITLIAARNPQTCYYLCHQSPETVDIESELLELHHYKVARELGQLERAQSFSEQDIFSLWEKIGRSRLLGQNKIETLVEVDFFNLEKIEG